MSHRRLSSFVMLLLGVAACAVAAPATPPREGDVVLRDFRFTSGEHLDALRLHYLTLGQPHRDAAGHIDNAVLVLHGTGGAGRNFLTPVFANVLYPAGGALDTTRYWVILPDGIGHGASSKPSDGLHMRFPRYGYTDMVEAQFRLLTEGLGVTHLRLVMGTSMGGMHTWVWATRHPEFMDALMPLACNPGPIIGRNRLWRDMIIDAIERDPDWKGGEYTTQPRAGMREALGIQLIAGSAPAYLHHTLTDRDTVDRYLQGYLAQRAVGADANDMIYQLDASRDYDPSPGLERIAAPLVHVNSADDFINPPELGIAEKAITRVPHGRFVLIPASERTRGHGTHTWAVFWQDDLRRLLAEAPRR